MQATNTRPNAVGRATTSACEERATTLAPRDGQAADGPAATAGAASADPADADATSTASSGTIVRRITAEDARAPAPREEQQRPSRSATLRATPRHDGA